MDPSFENKVNQGNAEYRVIRNTTRLELHCSNNSHPSTTTLRLQVGVCMSFSACVFAELNREPLTSERLQLHD